MDPFVALDAATHEFGQRLAAVDEDCWARSTPCPEWDVRYLVAHVVGGNRFASMILDGSSATDAIDQIMSIPQLGDDPFDAWSTSVRTQAAAFQKPMALERPVDFPLGQITGHTFLQFRVFDITLHAWDLARSIEGDERLSADLVDAVLGIVENGPQGVGFGIGPLGITTVASSPQARLLDLAGRDPT